MPKSEEKEQLQEELIDSFDDPEKAFIQVYERLGLNKQIDDDEFFDITEWRKNAGKQLETARTASRRKGHKTDYLKLIAGGEKMGRYGMPDTPRINDSVTVLKDEKNTRAEDVYFDPFDTVTGQAEDSDELQGREKLKADFLSRVNMLKELIHNNDLEKGYYGEEEKDYIVACIVGDEINDMLDDNKKLSLKELQQKARDIIYGTEETLSLAQKHRRTYDAAKKFEKDFDTDESAVPDGFEFVVAVQPPSDIYIDYSKERTKQTPMILKSLRSQPDYYKIVDSQMKKSKSYQEIVEKGRLEAEKLGLVYDERNDPNIDILRAQIMYTVSTEQGHSFIRMVSKKGARAIHSYSFGFWPLVRIAGMGAITKGEVMNPDPDAKKPDIIERRHSVSFPDYLKAAAKIRGTVGSQRTYSFIGYNCTSFAADMAKEAGIDIKPEDSGEKMLTFRSRTAIIDSPYSLAKYVRKGMPENAEIGNELIKKWKTLSFEEQFDELLIRKMSDQIDERTAYRKVQKENGASLASFEDSENTTGLTLFGKELSEMDEQEISNNRIEEKMFVSLYKKIINNQAINGIYDEYKFREETKEEFIERFFEFFLYDVYIGVEKINDEVKKSLDEVTTGERYEQYDGDVIQQVRDNAINDKRRKMKELFKDIAGAEVVEEKTADNEAELSMIQFITNVCTNPDWLENAVKYTFVEKHAGNKSEVRERERAAAMSEEDKAVYGDMDALYEKILFGLKGMGDTAKRYSNVIYNEIKRILGIEKNVEIANNDRDKLRLAAFAVNISESMKQSVFLAETGNEFAGILMALGEILRNEEVIKDANHPLIRILDTGGFIKLENLSVNNIKDAKYLKQQRERAGNLSEGDKENFVQGKQISDLLKKTIFEEKKYVQESEELARTILEVLGVSEKVTIDPINRLGEEKFADLLGFTIMNYPMQKNQIENGQIDFALANIKNVISKQRKNEKTIEKIEGMLVIAGVLNEKAVQTRNAIRKGDQRITGFSSSDMKTYAEAKDFSNQLIDYMEKEQDRVEDAYELVGVVLKLGGISGEIVDEPIKYIGADKFFALIALILNNHRAMKMMCFDGENNGIKACADMYTEALEGKMDSRKEELIQYCNNAFRLLGITGDMPEIYDESGELLVENFDAILEEDLEEEIEQEEEEEEEETPQMTEYERMLNDEAKELKGILSNAASESKISQQTIDEILPTILEDIGINPEVGKKLTQDEALYLLSCTIVNYPIKRAMQFGPNIGNAFMMFSRNFKMMGMDNSKISDVRNALKNAGLLARLITLEDMLKNQTDEEQIPEAPESEVAVMPAAEDIDWKKAAKKMHLVMVKKGHFEELRNNILSCVLVAAGIENGDILLKVPQNGVRLLGYAITWFKEVYYNFMKANNKTDMDEVLNNFWRAAYNTIGNEEFANGIINHLKENGLQIV